jgi:hypothetical protein
VARVRLGGAGVPRTAVVKWAPTARVRTEAAALRFLSDDLGLGIVPRVIAAEPSAGGAAGFIVVEDLAPRTALDGLLRRDGAAAHGERLAAFARLRGELGAATAGRARRPGIGDDERAAAFARFREEAYGHAAALGAPIAGPAAAELASALDELNEPGPFTALSNHDAEANNVLLHASGPADARLIDFEHAGWAHALTDAVPLHVPGPAWLSVGDPLSGHPPGPATGLADHYRRALTEGVPEAEDDRRYGFGLAAACLSWAIVRLRRFATLDARPPDDDSRRQLVATLEAAARTAGGHHALPHLAGWSRHTAETLRRRWPDADQDLTDPAAFPPYTVRRRRC